uniref:Uncharacterized protein n=1 Tax=Arundo donax TaxID=35708 RepID=A0A0A9HLA5_ARUDO
MDLCKTSSSFVQMSSCLFVNAVGVMYF